MLIGIFLTVALPPNSDRSTDGASGKMTAEVGRRPDTSEAVATWGLSAGLARPQFCRQKIANNSEKRHGCHDAQIVIQYRRTMPPVKGERHSLWNAPPFFSITRIEA